MLDRIAYHDPVFHTATQVWYYAAPGVAVLLAGSLALSVWRVWLQPRAKGGGKGQLPPWSASPADPAPSVVVGELHHPIVPREIERPSWLVIPETGLYTGVLIVGAVGSGKTSACMYPFAASVGIANSRVSDYARRAARGRLLVAMISYLYISCPAPSFPGPRGQAPGLKSVLWDSDRREAHRSAIFASVEVGLPPLELAVCRGRTTSKTPIGPLIDSNKTPEAYQGVSFILDRLGRTSPPRRWTATRGHCQPAVPQRCQGPFHLAFAGV